MFSEIVMAPHYCNMLLKAIYVSLRLSRVSRRTAYTLMASLQEAVAGVQARRDEA